MHSSGLALRSFLSVVLLVGVAVLGPPVPRRAAAEPSAPIRITTNPGDDEDPTVVLARDGRFHVVWSSVQGGRVDLFLRSSRDGRNWADERRITDDAVEDYYPSLIQSRDGVFHLAWFRLQRAEGRTDIWYARSADGVHWSSPLPITTEGQDWAPVIYEAAGGGLWIVWSSRGTGNRELSTSYSGDGGRRWSPPTQITHSPEEDDFPHVHRRLGGERILVWTRYASGSPLLDYYKDPTAEIVLAASRDGLEWSAPSVVTPPDPDARFVEFLPLALQSKDELHAYVSWTSNRNQIDRGDILLREIFTPTSPVRQLVTGGYDAKIAPTRRRGEYLMVWVSSTGGKKDIFARRFRL
jgi:hypothetical protein